MKKLLALLALSLIAHAAQAQTTNSTSDDTASDRSAFIAFNDRFQLWTDCAPVELVVERLTQDAIDIGLTVESLETLVRSRLRSARIYTNNSRSNYLYLKVAVVGRAFSSNLRFNKRVIDTFSGLSRRAVVWDHEPMGTHGGDAGFIRQFTSESVDVFIDEYLRVNAESCGGPRGVR